MKKTCLLLLKNWEFPRLQISCLHEGFTLFHENGNFHTRLLYICIQKRGDFFNLLSLFCEFPQQKWKMSNKTGIPTSSLPLQQNRGDLILRIPTAKMSKKIGNPMTSLGGVPLISGKAQYSHISHIDWSKTMGVRNLASCESLRCNTFKVLS